MNNLPDWLLNNDVQYDSPISKRYADAWDSYIKCFGDAKDLLKYTSTYDYTEEDFLELAKKIENCVETKKRYKYLYMCLIERIWENTLGPFIKYTILKIYENA